MEFSQIVFLVNDLSRSGRRTADAVNTYMKVKNIPYRIIKVIGSAFDLESFIKENPQTLYVIAGGDGSLNYYITYLEERNIDVPISYLATGSGNDFARSLGIPRSDIEAGLDYIFSLRDTREFSVIKATAANETFYAINSLGFGIDAWANKKIGESPRAVKRILGSNIYLLEVVPSFFDMTPRHVQVIIEDEVHDYYNSILAIVVNNAYFGGGIKIHPTATAFDEEFKIIVLDDIKLSDIPGIVKPLLTDQTHLNHPKFHTFSASNFKLNILEEEYGQKDGELIDKNIYSLEVERHERSFWI